MCLGKCLREALEMAVRAQPGVEMDRAIPGIHLGKGAGGGRGALGDHPGG